MKIRITKKPLPKHQGWNSQVKPSFNYQQGLDKITGKFGVPAPQMKYTPMGAPSYDQYYPKINTGGFPSMDQDEDITDDFYKQNPQEKAPKVSFLQEAVNAGVGPSRELDDADKLYQNSPEAQKEYDNSLLDYHLSNPWNRDAKKYTKWYDKKYDQEGNFVSKLGNLSNNVNMALQPVFEISALLNHRANQRKDAAYRRSLREQNLFATPMMPDGTERGDYTVNEGMFRPDQMQPVNKGMYTNKYYGSRMIGEEGGTLDPYNNDAMKIRIIGRNMEYGGQMGYGLDLARRKVYTDMPDSPEQHVSSSITEDPNPDSPYVLEAEGDETISRPDGSFATFQGKSHAEGGIKTTAEQTPAGSYIFSKVLKEKRPEVLQALGVNPKKYGRKGVSYADLTKPYNTNRYIATINNKDADPLSKKTAEMMVDKYRDKHALVALAQESLKGFPEGIPDISQSVMPQMKFGGALPQFQGTKRSQVPPPAKTKEQEIFDEAMLQRLREIQAKKEAGAAIVSPRMKAGDNRVPAMQSRQRIGVYGDVTPEQVDEFMARQSWYLKDRPNWDPRKKADVDDFQRKYNERFRERFGKDYFDGSTRVKAIDGLFGEYTYNAPGLEDTPVPQQQVVAQKWICVPGQGPQAISPDHPANSDPYASGVYNSEAEALVDCPYPEKKEQKVEEKPEPWNPNQVKKTRTEEPPFGYMYPDMRRMRTARMFAPEMILPYYADIQSTIPQPAFEDWRAKAAARQAMYNTAARTMAQSGPTQGLAANLSFMAGQQGDPLIQDIAQTEARNIGIANPFAMAQAEVLNKENQYNTMNKDRRYAGWATARQQYKNAMRNYVRDIDTADIAGWKNRSQLHMVNMTNPYYFMDPYTGGTQFRGGMGIDKLANNWTSGDNQDNLNGYKSFYDKAVSAGMDDAEAKKYAFGMITGAGRSRTNPFAAMQQQSANYAGFTSPSPYRRSSSDDDE